MVGERTNEGWVLQLESRGVARYVSAAFLAFWLSMWAVGESLVLFLLIKGGWALLTGTPPDPGREPLELGPAVMAGLFLLVWLALWTVGGIAAGSELMRLLWGIDRMAVTSGRLSVTWIRGIFRSTRHFDRDSIRDIALIGRHGRLQLQAGRRRVELSALGSREERVSAAAALKAELGLAETAAARPEIPEEWEAIVTPEGERALVGNPATRRSQARVVSAATLFLGVITVVLGRQAIQRLDLIVPTLILLVFTIGLTVGTLWLARGRWEWRLGSGRLTLRKRYGGDVRDVFEARRLLIDTATDSDGDPWYELLALADSDPPPKPAMLQWRPTQPKNSRSVARVMSDPTGVRDLGGWLSRETGLPLDDRTTAQAREIQLVEVRAMLEQSGPFGQWIGKQLDRMGSVRKRNT